MPTWDQLAICFIVTLIGPILFGHAAYESCSSYAEAKDWQACEAKIIKSTHRFCRRKRIVEIWYSYRVGNRTFYSNRLDHSGSSTIELGDMSRSSICKRLPVGKEVVVYFDPENPERSVMHPGISGGMIVEFAGLSMGLLTALVLCFPDGKEF